MKKSITTKQYFMTLNLTYYMQAFSVLLFALVVAFLVSGKENAPSNDARMWNFLVPMLIIISLVIAYILFNFLIKAAKKETSIRKKMPAYAKAVLVRSALIQLPAFLSAIAAFLTSQLYFVGASVLLFFVYLLLRPTRNIIANDLALSTKERALLDEQEAVIGEVG